MYIIKHGTVHVGNGRVEEDCDILIDGKKIVSVGKNLENTDARVINAANRHVFPGFIDPVSSIGAMGIPTSYPDINEKTNPVTPEMNIKYSMDPDEINNQEFYKSGITSIGLSPGNANVIGGQMAVFKTAPMKIGDRLVKEQAGLKCCVTSDVTDAYGSKDAMPMTKMGVFHLLEKTIREAGQAGEETRTRGQKAVAAALSGEMSFFISAQLKSEMDAVFHLLEEETCQVHFIDGYSFEGCMDQMLEKKAGLIIGNISNLSQVTKHDMNLTLLQKLVENGNPVAVTNTCGGSSEGREILLWTAIEVYRAGVDAEEVVKMLTLNPARMLQADHRIGSLEPGKDADLTIFTGHPITTYAAKAEHSMIDGEVVF